jgi:hypothetical protein
MVTPLAVRVNRRVNRSDEFGLAGAPGDAVPPELVPELDPVPPEVLPELGPMLVPEPETADGGELPPLLLLGAP